MRKIICNRAEYVTTENIGGEWNTIEVFDTVKYTCKTTNEDAGRLVEEQVTMSVFRDSETADFLNENSYQFFVLRLHSNEGEIIVGGKEYPCLLEINGDGIIDNLTFTRKSTR